MERLNYNEFVKRAREIHGDKYDYSKVVYKNATTPVIIICPLHGEFKQRPVNHVNAKQGCPKCSHQSYPNTKELFIAKAREKYGNKYQYDKVVYKNNKSKVIVTCPEHGDFETRVDNFLHGHQCPVCALKARSEKRALSREEFIRRACEVYPDENFDYSKVVYKNFETKITVICKKHGSFKVTPDNFLHGHNCPHCATSMMEMDIKKFLNENGIEFVQQKTFDWLKYREKLKLDFYLPQFNVAIECQGLQHFKPVEMFGGESGFNDTIIRDKVKMELCEKNGIEIIYYSNIKDKTPKNIIKNKGKLLEKIYEKDINNSGCSRERLLD